MRAVLRLGESVNVSVNFRRQRNTDYVRNQSGTMLRERVTLLRVSVTRIGHLGLRRRPWDEIRMEYSHSQLGQCS